MDISNTIIKILDPKDSIEHFGVKGMRWGVRRGSKRGSSSIVLSRIKGASGSAFSLVKKKVKDATIVNDDKDNDDADGPLNHLRSKPISKMTNGELKSLAKRMELETKISELRSKEGEALRKNKTKYLNTAISLVKATNDVYDLSQRPGSKKIWGKIRGVIASEP